MVFLSSTERNCLGEQASFTGDKSSVGKKQNDQKKWLVEGIAKITRSRMANR